MSSVGQAVGGLGGAVIGFIVGGPQGAMYGAQIGMTVGGILDPPKGPNINGPRLSDLTVQTSTYGAVIPRTYGTISVYGNVFWLENNSLKEVAKKTKSGGKGGGRKTTTTTFSYFATFAVSLCDCPSSPIVGVRRIWIKDTLFYDAGSLDSAALRVSNANSELFTVHTGDENQVPDDRMQASLGVANTSAFRGLAYIVFKDLPLAAYGNSMMGAQVKVEVVQEGSIADYSVTDARRIPPPALGNDIWSDVAWNGRQFVAVRNCGNNNYTVGMIATSPDGKNWTLRDIPSSPNVYGIVGVYASPDIFLAVHDYWPNYIWASRDGISWYAQYCPANPGYCALSFNGTWWMAMAREYNGQCAISKDGVTWAVPQSTIPSYGSFNAKCLSSNESVFLAAKGTTAYIFDISTLLWNTSSITGRTSGVYITGYWKAKGCFVALGNTEASFSYDNGKTWVTYTTTGLGGNPWFFVDCGNFVSCAWNYSFDGITWIYRSLPHYEAVSIYGGAWDGANLLWVGADSYNINNCFSITPHVLAQENPILSTVLQSECLQSKLLSSSDLDTSLMIQPVRGFKISSSASIRSGFDPLQGAWPFDIIQAGYKIKFKPRGSVSVATIPIGDLDARKGGSSSGISLTNSREMDSVLPRRLQIKYLDVDREYDSNEQYSERLNTDAINLETLEIAIVMTADEAIQASERLLYMRWLERYELSFKLPPTYNSLEPGDVITLVAEDGTFNLRLPTVNYTSDGHIECNAKYSSSATYISTAIGGKGASIAQVLRESGNTVCKLLDIPLIIDAQDTPGFSVAVSSYFPNWPGTVLFQSDDLGQTWTELQGYLPPGSIIGYASGIGAGRTDLIDKSNIIIVSLLQGTLSSVTETSLLNGANLFAYGAGGRWEIIGAQTCILQADGTYLLSDLLRGRFGTEWACGLHVNGDTIVLLNTSYLTFMVMSSNTIGLARDYRAVTLGEPFDSVSNDSFIYKGVNLECLAPVYFNGSRDPTSLDWNITWLRRTRKGGEWRDLVDATLSETSESYDVEIYSDGLYTTIKRTITVPTPNFTYTNAMQVADFGSVQMSLIVKIYQKSNLVGQGYPLKAWLPRTQSPPWPSLVWLSMNDVALSDFYSHTVTKYGSVSRSSVRSKWGYSSYHANVSASADYLAIAGIPALGQQVFCMECWAYFTDLSPGNSYLFTYSADNAAWGFSVMANGGSIGFKASNYPWVNVSVGFIIDKWFHVRLVYTGGSAGCFYLYVDGNYVGGICNMGFNGNQPAQSITVGRYNFRGYIDDFRLTVGNSRGADIQPPNAEFLE